MHTSNAKLLDVVPMANHVCCLSYLLNALMLKMSTEQTGVFVE